MSAKKKTVDEVSTATAVADTTIKTVTIGVDAANMLYELFRNIESADAHFKTCQSAQFRQHMRSVYQSTNVFAAFETLRASIDAIEEG